jgi:predicted nucleic acid-binding protein
LERVLTPFPGFVKSHVAGILHASDDTTRTRRADTLALVRAADPIPIGEAIMVTWARLVSASKAAGVHRTIKLTDALIAATAIEHGLPVVTQDSDYDQMARAYPDLQVLNV